MGVDNSLGPVMTIGHVLCSEEVIRPEVADLNSGLGWTWTTFWRAPRMELAQIYESSCMECPGIRERPDVSSFDLPCAGPCSRLGVSHGDSVNSWPIGASLSSAWLLGSVSNQVWHFSGLYSNSKATQWVHT
ncbi:hypothetical protein ACOSQ2_031294 [Xanthoceras sorbifolium]